VPICDVKNKIITIKYTTVYSVHFRTDKAVRIRLAVIVWKEKKTLERVSFSKKLYYYYYYYYASRAGA